MTAVRCLLTGTRHDASRAALSGPERSSGGPLGEVVSERLGGEGERKRERREAAQQVQMQAGSGGGLGAAGLVQSGQSGQRAVDSAADSAADSAEDSAVLCVRRGSGSGSLFGFVAGLAQAVWEPNRTTGRAVNASNQNTSSFVM